MCVLYRWPHLLLGDYRIHFAMIPQPPWVGGGQRVIVEVHAAQTVHFCENFITQKLNGTLKMEGWVRSDQVLDITQVSSG